MKYFSGIKYIGIFLTVMFSLCGSFSYGFRPEEREGDPNPPFNFLRINVIGGTSLDEMIVYFDDDATDQYDEQFDALKMISGNPGVPNIYTKIDNGDYSINVLGPFKKDIEVPVSLNITQNGSYLISVVEMTDFEPTTMIYLEDRLNGKFYNLRLQDKITFQFISSVIANRFFLHFDLPSHTSISGESCRMNDGTVNFYNPSENPWDLKLLSEDGLTIIKEASTVSGKLRLTGISGGDYMLNMLKRADGFSYSLPVHVPSGIPIISDFTCPSGKIRAGQNLSFSANQQGLGLIYSWDMGDGNILSGDSVVQHTYEFPGIYTITLLVSNGECSGASQQTIIITPDVITGLISKEEKVSTDLSIFPNPAADFITIRFGDNLPVEPLWLEIMDFSGRIVRKDFISGLLTDEYPLSIPVRDLNNGQYLLRISGEKEFSVGRFTINH